MPSSLPLERALPSTVAAGIVLPSLAALGDLVLDVIVTPSAALATGSDVPGAVRLRRGGSAANVCDAFAGLGARSVFVGAVGADALGDRLVRVLRSAGVETRVVRAEAPTARLLALVAADGERTFVTERGAADQLRVPDLRATWLHGIGALHIPGYSLYNEPIAGAASRAAELAHAGGSIVSVDLSSREPMLAFGRERTREVVAAVRPDVLFANASEAEALEPRGPDGLLELAAVVAVKEGGGGATVLMRERGRIKRLQVATEPIEAADTTGAGDAFAAGFLFSVLAGRVAARGAPLEWTATSLRRAAAMGHDIAAKMLRSPRPELAL
jgi:sugar/nucleoside kinase (ribokinase family)